ARPQPQWHVSQRSPCRPASLSRARGLDPPGTGRPRAAFSGPGRQRAKSRHNSLIMHTRHRTPSIFNLSMVDVLCCALGCVILLWLLNLREARQRADEVSQTDEQLTLTRKELAAAVGDRDALRRQLDDAAGQLAGMTAAARSLQ